MSTGAIYPAVKGWCPGALQPMQSGDGLMVRLKLTGGIVDVALARRIADWSRRWGNGQIDLSSRSNLQLRGLSAGRLGDLQHALTDLRLLDRSVAGEAVRNVICSPLAGLDPGEVLDVRPIAHALEQRLASDTALHRLPGKFGFAIDGGGLPGLADVPADIRFVAHCTVDGPAFAIHLDGAPRTPVGYCLPDRLAEDAAELSRLFLHHRTGRETEMRRMRDLVAVRGIEAIARDLGRRCAAPPGDEGRVQPFAFLGAHRLGSAAVAGVGLPFGRVTAENFASLASRSAALGASSLRLTPWRTILVPVATLPAAHEVLAGPAMACFIRDPSDPRRRIAACPGAPSCARGTTPVRSDATAFATRLTRVAGFDAAGSGIILHVSGCEKGCAHANSAPLTLVARNGRYDLVRDGPAAGQPVLRNLTADQAANHIQPPRGCGA